MVRQFSVVVQWIPHHHHNNNNNDNGSRIWNNTNNNLRNKSRTLIMDDLTTGEWIWQTIYRNDNNWLLAMVLTLHDIYTRQRSVCRIDCGDGHDIIVLLGHNTAASPNHNNIKNDSAAAAKDEEEEPDVTTIPCLTVVAGIAIATTDHPGGGGGVDRALVAESYGVISAHESLYDHIASLIETGHRSSELLVCLDVVETTRPTLVTTTTARSRKSGDITNNKSKSHVVRILGAETSWDNSAITIEVVQQGANVNYDSSSRVSHDDDNEDKDDDETTSNEIAATDATGKRMSADATLKPPPAAKKARKRSNSNSKDNIAPKSLATAASARTLPIANCSTTASVTVATTTPQAAMMSRPAEKKAPPPTAAKPIRPTPQKEPRKVAAPPPSGAALKTAIVQRKIPPTGAHNSDDSNSTTASPAYESDSTVRSPASTPGDRINKKNRTKKTQDAAAAVASFAGAKAQPVENNDDHSIDTVGSSSSSSSSSQSDEDDDTSNYDENVKATSMAKKKRSYTATRKARECCYAPFCIKLATECGGFHRGRCQEVNDGRVVLPSEKEFQKVKLEHRKARKAEFKRVRNAEEKKRRGVPEGKIKDDGDNSASNEDDDKSTSTEKVTAVIAMKKPTMAQSTPQQQRPGDETTSKTTAKKTTPKFKTSRRPPPEDVLTETEIAALERAYYPNGKLFNPKEYLLLEKAFNDTLSEKDAMDSGETILKKDIKAATALFRDLEQAGNETRNVKSAKSSSTQSVSTAIIEKKVSLPKSAVVKTVQVAMADTAKDLVVGAVASPATETKKKKDPSSSVKKSSKKKKKKKDKKRKRDSTSHGKDDRGQVIHSQDTLSE